MKSFLGHLAVLLILLAALSFYLFPYLSDQYEQAQRMPMIEKFEKQVKSMGADQAAAIEASWKQYNASLFSGAQQA